MTDRPGLTRRDFLRLGVVAPVSLAAACGWDGGPVLEPRLRAISRLNDWVGEKIFFSPTRLAREYPVALRTPVMQFPAYSIAHNLTGAFPAVPADWALEVGGLVRTPVRLTRTMLEAMPRVSYTVQPTPEARYLRFDSFDHQYSNGWDLASAMHPQTILAYAWNDRPLTIEHGAPLRLYSPVKLGYKLTKYLTAMTFTRERPGGYWEDQGYPWLGGI
jgi:DMSO/TMAO reductase YedYZ molybdopterin-dependent catalytic subunit